MRSGDVVVEVAKYTTMGAEALGLPFDWGHGGSFPQVHGRNNFYFGAVWLAGRRVELIFLTIALALCLNLIFSQFFF